MVEIISHIRIYFSLFIYLLLSLLCDKAFNRGCCINVPVLRLHDDYGIFVLLINWNNWISGMFLVYTKNLQRCKSGLDIQFTVVDRDEDENKNSFLGLIIKTFCRFLIY